MKKVFYPGCRIKAGYPKVSAKLKSYLAKRYQLEAVNCCKVDYSLLEKEDTAVLICNNCVVDLKKNMTLNNIEYVYDLINQDETFNFPDYHDETFYLQDCEYGYDHPISQTVRSLLDKMHIRYIPLENKVLQKMNREEHRQLVMDNAKLSTGKVITYCAICNLAYKNANKETYLLLELLFRD